MKFFNSPLEFTLQDSGVNAAGNSLPIFLANTNLTNEYLDIIIAVRENQGRICALWGEEQIAEQFAEQLKNQNDADFLILQILLATNLGYLQIKFYIKEDNQQYSAPDISGIFPAANRMQRAVSDLLGIIFVEEINNNVDSRAWLRHNGWASDYFPLRKYNHHNNEEHINYPSDYPFVTLGGEGSHQIPVGPIHAGIIEPGHFRFSVVGERVLRLEERLGYLHRGIEKLLIGKDINHAAKIVGRISGDSTIAYTWAYCSAVESALDLVIPPRAVFLRAILLERERVANHLGDIAGITNDAAFAFGYSQFTRLKEDWISSNQKFSSHRYLMDTIVVGGVSGLLATPQFLRKLMEEIDILIQEVKSLDNICQNHSGLQERFVTTGKINSAIAEEFSITGIAARSCGVNLDSRCRQKNKNYLPITPYQQLNINPIINYQGDVAARVAVRFAEIYQSLRIIKELIIALPEGEMQIYDINKSGNKSAIGIIEGWRGEVIVYVSLDANGNINRVHAHDPSWQAWPVLELAVVNDIVPDFPLINKSFNLSYAGVDL